MITLVFTNRNSEEDSYEEFSLLEVYQYNINNLADLEETYLISLIEDESLKTINLMNTDLEGISDEVIMEYLLAENHIEYYIINEY